LRQNFLSSFLTQRTNMHPTVPRDEGEPREWARAIGPDAFDALKKLAFESESQPTRLAAIKEILDRGYGRSPLAGGGSESGEQQPPLLLVKESLWPNDPNKAIPDPSRR
jgi:hypothetical protein